MNDKDDSALVPRPPGALERAEPGAKRIVSDMVADALVLVRKASPPRIVVANDNPPVLQSVEAMIRHWSKDVTLLLLQNSTEAWLELSRTNPDFLIWVVSAPLLRGQEIIQRLKDRKVTYPIIVISAYDPDALWVQELARRGLNVSFLPMPFNFAMFRKLLEVDLKTPRDTTEKPVENPREIASLPHGTRPPRIVVVDDESSCLEIFALLIRDWFKDVTLLEFSNSSDAWQELSRTDPDLLILDMHLAGVEMLPLLAEKKVKYPIFVTSGLNGEKEMRQHTDPILRVSYLIKPFSSEQLFQELLIHVGPSDNPQRKIWKSEP